MVKKLIGLSCAALLLVFALTGCSNTVSETDSLGNVERQSNASSQGAIPSQSQGQDYTIEVPAYDIDDATITPAGSALSEASFAYPCQTISQLDTHSSAIIAGTIADREFFSYDGNAYTKLNIAIDQCVKGDFVSGDVISVVQLGGYISIADIVAVQDNGFRFADIPQEQWATTYFMESLEGDGFPEIGEQYAYFLQPEPLFSGAYFPVNEYESTFFMGADGKFARHNPVEGYVVSEGEFSATLKANGETYPNNAGNEVIDSFTLDDLFSYFG